MPFSPAPASNFSNCDKKDRTAIYSFNWASTIVERAIQSHTRAWKIILQVSGLTERQLAFLIACNDPAWPWLRSLSHLIDRWQAQQTKVGPRRDICTAEILRHAVGMTKHNCPEALFRYLTAKIDDFILSEQVKKGGGEGDQPDPPGLFDALEDSNDDIRASSACSS